MTVELRVWGVQVEVGPRFRVTEVESRRLKCGHRGRGQRMPVARVDARERLCGHRTVQLANLLLFETEYLANKRDLLVWLRVRIEPVLVGKES